MQERKMATDRTILKKSLKDCVSCPMPLISHIHSTCYAWIAYPNSLFKSELSAEFMAATLLNNMNQIKDKIHGMNAVAWGWR
jgi:DNA polymerase-3 subunit alpha